MTLLLTVVIPYHSTPQSDRSAMLQALVASTPDRNDVEIVVVDDASTAPMPELPRALSRLRIERTVEGRRLAGAARNIGLEVAQGRFVTFADSDDLFATATLERVLQDLKNLPDEGFPVLVMRAHEFTRGPCLDPGELLYPAVFQESDPDPARLLAKWHSPWGKVFPGQQALAAGVRFAENQPVANDALFSARLALAATDLRVMDTAGYFVRRAHGTGALTARRDPRSIDIRIETYRQINACFTAAGRTDLVIPMHHAFRAYFRSAPATVLRQVFRSLRSRDPLLPQRMRVLSKSARPS